MEPLTIIQIILVGILLYVIYDTFKPIKDLENLTADEVKARIKSKKAVLVDVRNPVEFRGNHIPGAINLPLPQLKRNRVNVPVDKDLILYCQTGIRSKQAAKAIKKRHKNATIAHLTGGLYTWKSEASNKGKKK